MKLSPNFTLAELTVTNTGLFNSPNAERLANLVSLASTLEKVRSALGGKPIIISSGYRSEAVNAAVKGARNSAHIQGLAADFTCHKFGTPLQVCEAIRQAGIEVDQVIHEYGRWIHLGISKSPRMQFLTIDNLGTRVGLHEVRK